MDNEEKTLNLILAIKKHPMLYDLRTVEYKNSSRKQELWKEIAAECGFENEQKAQSKWKYVRDYYTRLVRSEKPSPGNFFTENKRTRWPLKEQMEFMRDIIENSRSESILVTSGSEDERPSTSTQNSTSIPATSNTNSNSKKKFDPYSREAERKLLMDYIREKRKSKQVDRISTFFSHIEGIVRSLNTERQLIARERISNLVCQLEREEMGDRNRLMSGVPQQNLNMPMQVASASSPYLYPGFNYQYPQPPYNLSKKQ